MHALFFSHFFKHLFIRFCSWHRSLVSSFLFFLKKRKKNKRINCELHSTSPATTPSIVLAHGMAPAVAWSRTFSFRSLTFFLYLFLKKKRSLIEQRPHCGRYHNLAKFSVTLHTLHRYAPILSRLFIIRFLRLFNS